MTQDNFLFETFGKVPLCGCGNPNATWLLLRRTLEHCNSDGWQALRRDLLPDEGVRYLALGVLDSAGLIEHGGTIDCSWLTDDGYKFLALMTFNPDDDESIDAWVDDASGLDMGDGSSTMNVRNAGL